MKPIIEIFEYNNILCYTVSINDEDRKLHTGTVPRKLPSRLQKRIKKDIELVIQNHKNSNL